MKKRIIIPVVIVALLALVIFVVLPAVGRGQAAAQAAGAFQTEPARLGSVNSQVSGTGNVRANQSATLAWQISGKVASVEVQKGQAVAADAPLVMLEDSSLPQNVLQARVDLVNAREMLDNALNNREARADAYLALVLAQQALDDAEKEAQSKLYQRASQETIDGARAELIMANDALEKAEEIYNTSKSSGNEMVYAAGLSQYADARRRQQRAQYNLDYVQGLPDPLSVDEANARLEQASAQLETATANWEKVKDGPDADEVLAAQTRVDIAQATLDTASLTAPFAGTVTRIDSKVGDLVNPGQFAVQIDDLLRLLVDVEISEVDINQVQVGQFVTLTFDAIPGNQYAGSVTDIASVGSATGGTVNFTVTVTLDAASPEIRPGMTAAVNILVSQHDNVLLVPSRAVRTVDGQRVVYVLKNGVPTVVEIELGDSSNNYSEIVSGEVREGDEIVLNPSTNMFPMGPGRGMNGGGGGE